MSDLCPLCNDELEDSGCGLSCLQCNLIMSNDCCNDNNVSCLALGFSHGDCEGYDSDPKLILIPRDETINVDDQEVLIYDLFREHGPFMFSNEDQDNFLKLYRNKDQKPYLLVDRETLKFDFYDGTGLMWQCQTCKNIYYSSTD